MSQKNTKKRTKKPAKVADLPARSVKLKEAEDAKGGAGFGPRISPTIPATTPINQTTILNTGISSTGGPDDGEWKSLNATKVVS